MISHYSPLGVTIVNNVELALSKGVPELDGSVSGSGNNLSVVGREGDAENVTSVSDELSGGQASVKIPQSEGLVPRGREGELTVRRDGDVGDKVVVSVQDLLWETERVLVSGELPNDDGLVFTSVTRRFYPIFYTPREAVKIMSGFSEEVAMAVTQPEWPARVPLNARGSAILVFFREGGEERRKRGEEAKRDGIDELGRIVGVRWGNSSFVNLFATSLLLHAQYAIIPKLRDLCARCPSLAACTYRPFHRNEPLRQLGLQHSAWMLY